MSSLLKSYTDKNHPVKLSCNNGVFHWNEGDNMYIKAVRSLWDDMSVHRKLDIPEGTVLKVESCYQCLYGTYIEVEYCDVRYSVKPMYVEVVPPKSEEVV